MMFEQLVVWHSGFVGFLGYKFFKDFVLVHEDQVLLFDTLSKLFNLHQNTRVLASHAFELFEQPTACQQISLDNASCSSTQPSLS
ncbi:uncharacterized protein LDX57_001691 [Aspergillus melleus]|uniref:uncharacterized protein n=1 Tax=Aspergillus melleus TaxID=138277 RepID=UPI001E8CCC37|nr:uncharacterized protein LDX57_001691 [Aspergillus melleus]KAH8423934.1 hypothetical protein LDX57_001691 [Aspergillus melleus]